MFVLHGTIKNNEYSLAWNNGKLSGNQYAVKLAYEQNKINHGLLGLCPSISSVKDGYLKAELSAYSLLRQYVFDKITKESNDWEEAEENVIY